jgi:hypothetical protein
MCADDFVFHRFTNSRLPKRQFQYSIDRVPPYNVGGATNLLGVKGWLEDAKVVSILATAFLQIK